MQRKSACCDHFETYIFDHIKRLKRITFDLYLEAMCSRDPLNLNIITLTMITLSGGLALNMIIISGFRSDFREDKCVLKGFECYTSRQFSCVPARE